MDRASAISWIQKSLQSGGPLSQRVLERLGHLPSARLFVDEADGPKFPLDCEGHSYRRSVAETQLATFLRRVANTGSWSVIVEDDCAKSGDPFLRAHDSFGYFENRVCWWAPCTDISDAVNTLNVAHYPMNGLLCKASVLELGLTTGCDIGVQQIEDIFDAMCAVVSSVYDDEAFVMLFSTDIAQLTDG